MTSPPQQPRPRKDVTREGGGGGSGSFCLFWHSRNFPTKHGVGVGVLNDSWIVSNDDRRQQTAVQASIMDSAVLRQPRAEAFHQRQKSRPEKRQSPTPTQIWTSNRLA